MTAMGDQEDAARLRIIKHMNADHQDSIRRYLEAYSRKSMYQTRHAQMTDISVNEMKFSCNGQQSTIAFDPPMKSLREARDRVVQMDKDALKILGRDDIPITKFIPPTVKFGHLMNFTQCIVAYATLPFSSNFKPGSLLYENLLYRFPSFAGFMARFSLIIFLIMLPIHLAEAVMMANKLSKHGLTPFDSLWWSWVGTCFVEGITSFWRLDGLIDEKRKEKEAKKH